MYYKILQSHDNSKQKNSAFIISRNTCKKLAEHRLRIGVSDVESSIKLSRSWNKF